jgi:ABC-type glycerol-3-phosphate transport system substrate-binding protein
MRRNGMSNAKGYRLVLFAAVTLLLLAACTPAAAPAPAAGSGEATAGPVVVQLWSTAWFPSSIGGRQALVDKFNEEYAGRIQVDYIQGDWGQGETYVQSGIAAGGGIACIVEWESEGGAQNWYRKGWVIDLRPYLTEERRALTTEAQWAAREYPDDGAIVSSATVLWEPMLMVLYNPAHLEAAGISPATVDDPWSWEELHEMAHLLTLDADGNHLGEESFDPNRVVQWGLLPRLDPEKVWEWGLTFAQQRMGEPVVREEDGKWGWHLDEKGAAVYEKFLTPIQVGISPELAIGIGGSTLHQAFVDGLASMIIRESFAIPIINDNYPDFEFAAMPTPFETGDTVFYKAGGEGMVITKVCENPEDAAEFVFWLMKPENLAVYAHGNGMLPGNYEALDFEPFKSDPTWDIIRDYLDRSVVFTTPFNPHLVEFRDTIVAPTLMEVVEGKRTFAEADALLQEQAEIVLNQ